MIDEAMMKAIISMMEAGGEQAVWIIFVLKIFSLLGHLITAAIILGCCYMVFGYFIPTECRKSREWEGKWREDHGYTKLDKLVEARSKK